MRRTLTTLAALFCGLASLCAQQRITLDSKIFHNGQSCWQMARIADAREPGELISTSGFQSISEMRRANIRYSYTVREDNGRMFVDLTLKNRSSAISFFNQIELLGNDGKHLKPSFYTDNFFSLMPGEQKKVTVETSLDNITDGAVLELSGWNTDTVRYILK